MKREADRPAELIIRACPTCHSSAIKEVVEDWAGEFRGERYVVPGLRFFSCPRCGERVYPPKAMRQIEAVSPGYTRERRLTGAQRQELDSRLDDLERNPEAGRPWQEVRADLAKRHR